jgi:hypothetical protein
MAEAETKTGTAMAPTTNTEEYRVVIGLRHNERLYAPGSVLELNEDEATPLLKVCAIEPVNPPPPKAVPEEEMPEDAGELITALRNALDEAREILEEAKQSAEEAKKAALQSQAALDAVLKASAPRQESGPAKQADAAEKPAADAPAKNGK